MQLVEMEMDTYMMYNNARQSQRPQQATTQRRYWRRFFYIAIPLVGVGFFALFRLYPFSFTAPVDTIRMDIQPKDYSSVIPITQDTNYISDPSVETRSGTDHNLPVGWSTNSWGTNTPVFSYLNTGHTGKHSLEVQITQYESGDAKWYFTPLKLQPGSEYLYTDYYQSNTTSRIIAYYRYANGTTSADELRNAPASTSWAAYKDSFVVPAHAQSVVVYHLISQVGFLITDDFALRGYTPVGFNRGLVTLTFDNGFESNIATVLPVLKKYGFKVTQYISSQYLVIDQQENPHGPDYVKAFFDAGNEIASHSADYVDLTKLTPVQQQYELLRSKRFLENSVGVGNVKNFALPFGAYTSQVLQTVKTYYRSDRTVDPGYNSKDNMDPYRLKVQNMLSTTTLAQFQGWLDKAKSEKTWLILVYHVVTLHPTKYDTPVADFVPQMQAIKNSGMAVVTINQGLNEVLPQTA